MSKILAKVLLFAEVYKFYVKKITKNIKFLHSV